MRSSSERRRAASAVGWWLTARHLSWSRQRMEERPCGAHTTLRSVTRAGDALACRARRERSATPSPRRRGADSAREDSAVRVRCVAETPSQEYVNALPPGLRNVSYGVELGRQYLVLGLVFYGQHH